MEFVTVVNRSNKTLKGTWDGRHYDITPGEHQFPFIQAAKFREQNPVMGSENPYTLERDYLIAIKEQGHDTSPLEQTDKVELMNRSIMAQEGDVVIIKGNGKYRPATDAAAPLSNDSAFVVAGSTK